MPFTLPPRFAAKIILVIGAWGLGASALATPPPPADCGAYYGKTAPQLAALAAHKPADEWTHQHCLREQFRELGAPALPAIATMLKSDNVQVRMAGVNALEGLASLGVDVEAMIPAMLRVYGDRASAMVQPSAERLLLLMGKKAAFALPLMLEQARRKNDAFSGQARLQTYFRIAELNGSGMAMAVKVLDQPWETAALHAEAAYFLSQKGHEANAALPAMERALARLDAGAGKGAGDGGGNDKGGRALLELYAKLAEPARGASFLLRQYVVKPPLYEMAGLAIWTLYERDKRSVIRALAGEMGEPGAALFATRLLVDLRRNDASVKGQFPDAAARLVPHLADSRFALAIARAVIALDAPAPGAASHLLKLMAASRADRSAQAVYMRALGTAGGIPESQAPTLLAVALAELQRPAVLDERGENQCASLQMLKGFGTLPPALVAPLKAAYAKGMHETNFDCPKQLLWALRTADSSAGIAAQMSIFLSPRLYDVCNASYALAPRKPALAADLLRYLPQAPGLRAPLLEQAVAIGDAGQGAAALRQHKAAVLPQLMRELSNPLSLALHAPDAATSIGQQIGLAGDGPSSVSWCGIPETKVGLAIFRLHVLDFENPAIVGKLVAAALHPDPATSASAMSVLYRIRERGHQKEALRRAVAGSKSEHLKALLRED